jgi:hypothetical protein
MKVVCAWCRKPMNNEPRDGSVISHGMTSTGIKTFDHYISTERLEEGTVLLRIDEAKEAEGRTGAQLER